MTMPPVEPSGSAGGIGVPELPSRELMAADRVLLHPGVEQALRRAQQQGWIGPGPLRRSVAHALEFLAYLPEDPDGPLVDLGSGGGLPGLVLTVERPTWAVTLVDADLARADALRRAVRSVGSTAVVVHGRAEDLARRTAGSWAAVTARSFARPSVTAPLAGRLLRPGGVLVATASVAEPWGHDVLERAGLRPLPAPAGWVVATTA